MCFMSVCYVMTQRRSTVATLSVFASPLELSHRENFEKAIFQDLKCRLEQ